MATTQYSIRAQIPRKKRHGISSALRRSILERDAHICFYCEYEATQVDHVIPYTYGGTDDEDNLVASCDICNRLAHNKVFDSMEAKRAHVRARYGPYLEGRLRRFRKKLSICPDCQCVFQPNVSGATAVLCRMCYRSDLRGERGSIIGKKGEGARIPLPQDLRR